MDILQTVQELEIFHIVAIVVGIVSFTTLVLLVSAWKKRRDKKEVLYQYVRENTGIDKQKVKPISIPDELKKITKSVLEKNFEELFWLLVIVFYNSLLFLFLSKAQFVFWFFSSLVILLIIAVLIWVLAINDYFVTLMPAMRAKAIMWNENFHKMLMSHTNKIFAFEDPVNYHIESIGPEEERKMIERIATEDEEVIKKMKTELLRKQEARLEEINSTRKNLGLNKVVEIHDGWDIVPDVGGILAENKNILLPKFLRGIRWVGLPPFYKVYGYRFKWASSEQKYDEKIGALITRPVVIEKLLYYITLKDDVYNMTVESSETADAIPINVEVTKTINIINPQKALFKTEKWLEIVINQLGPKIRKFVGTQGYFELIQAKNQEKNLLDYRSEKLFSDKNLEFIISAIRLIYGVNIKRVQLKEINPATKEAEEFIRASIQEFISARKSAGWEKEAVGFDRKYKAITKYPGGAEMYIMEQVKESKLRAYSPGGQGLIQTVKVEDATEEDKEDVDKKGGGEK